MKTFTIIIIIAVISLVTACTPCECPEEKKNQNPLLAVDGEFYIFSAIDAEGNELVQAYAEPSNTFTYAVLCKEYYETCQLYIATATDTVLLRSYKRPTVSKTITYPEKDE